MGDTWVSTSLSLQSEYDLKSTNIARYNLQMSCIPEASLQSVGGNLK